MMLLPADPATCPVCATKHRTTDPHNARSLYYQYRFYGVRGRWPTWADAVAHCTAEVREYWEQALRDRDAWTEPADGQPIADPPEKSFHQPIGDLSERGFGPEFDPSLKLL